LCAISLAWIQASSGAVRWCFPIIGEHCSMLFHTVSGSESHPSL
jgi:hypothetical protein